jgi:hypothetical protein
MSFNWCFAFVLLVLGFWSVSFVGTCRQLPSIRIPRTVNFPNGAIVGAFGSSLSMFAS